MREGGKKKTLNLSFEKLMVEGDEIKKNTGQISRKVGEGDGMNKQKKNSWKNVFYLLK